jgi:[ribosomal protein S5]-alanine N-acetyltransferase
MTVLEGPNVRLRPFAPPDYPAVFAWYNDPDIVAPFDRFETDTWDGFVEGIEHAEGDPNSLSPRFAVERRATPGVIGVVGFYRAHPVLEYLDVWYVLGDPSARGHGWGREAVGLLIDHLFATQTVARVGATCDVDNVPSYRLLEGLGLRREGTLKSALFHHGAWHDIHVYGITAPEWASRAPRS